jgi:Tfp pilus assembly PilM family ATPase
MLRRSTGLLLPRKEFIVEVRRAASTECQVREQLPTMNAAGMNPTFLFLKNHGYEHEARFDESLETSG